jgi:hypothetical protein
MTARESQRLNNPAHRGLRARQWFSVRWLMNLIYSHSYNSARAFAMHHEFMPGDWKWLRDPDVLLHNPRSDVFKVEHWEENPQRDSIDEAMERFQRAHRLGTVVDVDAFRGTLGVST